MRGLARSAAERQREFEAIFQQEDPWQFLTTAFERLRHRCTLELVPPEGLVLEVGCAEGVFTERMALHAARVIAFDLSPTALARARSRCGKFSHVALVLADLVTVELTCQFEAVVATEVLGYLDPELMSGLLGKMAGWLRPAGRLLTNPAHGTEEEWEALLRQAGLVVADRRRVNAEGKECLVLAAERDHGCRT